VASWEWLKSFAIAPNLMGRDVDERLMSRPIERGCLDEQSRLGGRKLVIAEPEEFFVTPMLSLEARSNSFPQSIEESSIL
tara:strand:- start:913 stop:1152 length:240 start_codon:yes stop_codon:yes gene_type:complete